MTCKELLDKMWNGESLTEAQLAQLERAGFALEVANYCSEEYARTQSHADLINEIGGDDGDGEHQDS